MAQTDKQTSKFLSLVLRHEPQLIGIELDPAGWVAVDELLAGCGRKGMDLSVEQLREIVASSDKQRFAISEDGTRIRANQGHSVPVELGYAPAEPPEVLYHGTAEKSAEAIRRDGLERRARHHVHLSERLDTASTVGQRHGKLVLFKIRAGDMHRAGMIFYKTPNGVWLTDYVPAEYIEDVPKQ